MNALASGAVVVSRSKERDAIRYATRRSRPPSMRCTAPYAAIVQSSSCSAGGGIALAISTPPKPATSVSAPSSSDPRRRCATTTPAAYALASPKLVQKNS
jgi:hypothetical protein